MKNKIMIIFPWIEIDDEPNKFSDRKFIERNYIALLSNSNKTAIDPRSSEWLGKYSPRERIKNSGLWNLDHINEIMILVFLIF